MKRLSILFTALIFLLSLPACSFAADKDSLDTAVYKAAAYIYNTVNDPLVDSVGGEWAVLGLARSGYAVKDSWYETYYQTVTDYVRAHDGVLHERKYTDYSRVVLGLTAAGYNPRNIAGYDLTLPLADYDKTVWQGVNGPVFALLALDSGNYPNPNRDLYIAEILRRQLPDGGFNLTAGNGWESGNNETADPDLTGMVLQALAKYQDRIDVKTATDKALNCLSAIQNADGGYQRGGDSASESVVQVLVALCELDLDPDDPRFIKNGHSLIDNIISHQNRDGSFRPTDGGGGNSQMSTEQALYGLAAAKRMLEGQNSLYRMDDAVKRGKATDTATAGEHPGHTGSISILNAAQIGAAAGERLPDKHAHVKAAPITAPGKTFPDIAGHKNQTAIEMLAARGIIDGKNGSSFDPDATMTRAEYAAIVTRGLALTPQMADVFADVDRAAWYAPYVGTAYQYGIVTGITATAFEPNGAITRQEAAVMTARAAKLCGMDTDLDTQTGRDILAQFGDYVTVADWAKTSIAFCYREKLLSDEEFEIMPEENVKRCEIAQMLYNMLSKARLI